MRPLALAPLVALLAGCGAKMPLPKDLEPIAMELSISGPPSALSAGPYDVRAYREISEKEADSVLGAASGQADRTFAFQLSQRDETLREVACRGYRRTGALDGAGLTCTIGSAGGNAFGQLKLTDGDRGSLRLGADTYSIAPQTGGPGTVVKKGDAATAAFQDTTPRTAWVTKNADAELQASMVAAVAATLIYRDFMKQAK